MPGNPPTPPKGTRTGGRRLWHDVLAKYQLEQHELALLREAVRTVDDLDALAAVLASEGVVTHGQQRVHPALVEARQLRIALARLIEPCGCRPVTRTTRPRVGGRSAASGRAACTPWTGVPKCDADTTPFHRPSCWFSKVFGTPPMPTGARRLTRSTRRGSGGARSGGYLRMLCRPR